MTASWLRFALSEYSVENQFYLAHTLARVVAGHAVQQDTHSSGILKHLHWLPIEQRIHFKLGTLTHNTLCSTQPAYLHSLLNYHTPTRSTLCEH